MRFGGDRGSAPALEEPRAQWESQTIRVAPGGAPAGRRWPGGTAAVSMSAGKVLGLVWEDRGGAKGETPLLQAPKGAEALPGGRWKREGISGRNSRSKDRQDDSNLVLGLFLCARHWVKHLIQPSPLWGGGQRNLSEVK